MNGTRQSITIASISSLDDPRRNETFPINRALAAGARVVLQTGAGATGSVLTRQSIYDDLAPTEGVRVVTSVGTVEQRCR